MSNTTQRLRRLTATSSMFVATVGAAGVAWADHSASFSPDAWFFEITHMPDFDQKRDGLPNSGNAYCVPTATMNLLAYFARHGNPEFRPGSCNWSPPARYDEMTDHLRDLGSVMGTDPATGTSLLGAATGLHAWLPPGQTVNVRFSSDGWSPGHQDVGIESIYGGYLMLSVGWYMENGSTITRSGGHQITLDSGARSGETRVLGFRDPASDDGDRRYQSPWTTEAYEITEVSRSLVINGNTYDARPIMKVGGYGSDDVQGYVDGYVAVFPNFALTDIDEGLLGIIQPHVEDHGGLPYRILPGFETPICYAIYGPDGTFLVKTCGDPPGAAEPDLYHGHPGADDWTLIDPAESFICVDVVLGQNGRVYLIDERQGVVCYDIIQEEVTNAVFVPGWNRLDSLTYAEPEDVGGPRYLYMFSREDLRFMRINADTLDPESVETLQLAGAPMLPNGAQIEAVPGRADRFWVWKPETKQAFVIALGDSGNAVIELAPFPFDVVAFAPGDAGSVLVSGDGVMHEYVATEDFQLEIDLDSPYEGQSAGRVLARSRSGNNFDPVIHEGPAWIHKLPTDFAESEPDLSGDFDFDGQVGFSDLLVLLGAWGTADIDADIAPDGGDGVVDFVDLLELLSAWGGC